MDVRLRKACYNVYHSDYILELIMQHLDLNEQVQLLDVSKRLAYVLAKFVWPKSCYQVTLYKTPYANIVSCQGAPEWQRQRQRQRQRGTTIRHDIKQPKVALSHKQCNEFLKLNAKNVKILKVFSEYYFFEKEVGVSFKNAQLFTNLSELCYYRLILCDEHMRVLGKKCNKLQKLHLLQCYNEYLMPLVPGEHLNLQNIYEMKNLQELLIESEARAGSVLKSHAIRGLVLNLKLKSLILRNFTINDNDAQLVSSCAVPVAAANRLEKVNFGLISMRFWPSFLDYLQHFEQLVELHINVSDCNTTLDIQVMDILARKCKHLEKLSLEKCDLSVDNFGLLKSLKHLSLTACGGFTFANFQEILGALTLTTFAFINTRIIGPINHIYVSPSLQEIVIDTIRFTHISDAFQKSLNKFENLHTLKWLNGDINDNWIIDKCPKLKYLHIPNPYLLRRIVFTMKSLKELTFTSCTGLSWCFILILIRNLTLERLHLQTSETINDDKEIPLHACGIKTTLQLIIMPFSIFKMAQSFWIDLLCLNDHMRFSIYGKHEEVLNGVFLDELMCDEKFCHRINELQICGFRFDCLDLLNNFNRCMHRLNKYTSHYRFKKENFTLEM